MGHGLPGLRDLQRRPRRRARVATAVMPSQWALLRCSTDRRKRQFPVRAILPGRPDLRVYGLPRRGGKAGHRTRRAFWTFRAITQVPNLHGVQSPPVVCFCAIIKRQSMRLGTIYLVSAVGLLLAGCAAPADRPFSPEADCVGEECQRAPDGADSSDYDGASY